MKGSILHKYDEYQQAFLDEKLEPNTVYHLRANSGAGKTSTAVAKISILSEQFSPDQILAVSFSNRSAGDIRNKVKSMLGVVYPYISTVHSTSIILLKMNNINPIIMNEWQSILCIRKIMEANNLAINNKKEDTQLARNLLQQFNKIRAVLFHIDINTIDIMNFVEHMLVSIPQFKQIYKLYELHKIQKNLWDFQDLVSPRALNLIKIKPDIKIVLVDESQDLSYSNYMLITSLFHKDVSMVVIYDLKQLLYSFQFAYSLPLREESFFRSFGFEKFKIFNLLYNYRSTSNIVRMFNFCGEKFDDAPSIPTKTEKEGSVKIVSVSTNAQEGLFIAQEIKALISSGVHPSKITVLARRSAYLQQIVEPALVSSNILYKIQTPKQKKKFFDVPINAVFFALVEYWSSNDLTKLASVAQHFNGIGQRGQEHIEEELISTGSITNQLFNERLRVINEFMMDDVGLASLSMIISSIIPKIVKDTEWSVTKLANVQKIFVNFVAQLDETISRDIVVQTMLDSIYDYASMDTDEVILTTIHQYKGIENEFIFVGDLTYVGSMDIDESTYPLVYVALSRAKEKMYVLDSTYIIDRKIGRMKAKLHPAWNYTKNLAIHHRKLSIPKETV